MEGPEVQFTQPAPTRIRLRDALSGEQYDVKTGREVDIETARVDSFPAPVTDAVSFLVEELRIDAPYGVYLLDDTGTAKEFIDFDGSHTTGDGVHYLQIDAPVKTYIRIEGSLTVTQTDSDITIQPDEVSSAVVAARARQCYPDSTITVTDSPTDFLRAVSHFGADMLTSSPERSFPTLRGHPPELERGETLDIPSDRSVPETGITVTVPPTWPAVLSVTPLVYYLRATAEPGEEFSIHTGAGYTYRAPDSDVPGAVRKALTHCFYLDCLARTEGLYPAPLQERRAFEAASETDLDFAALYEMDLPERTATYFQLDRSVVDSVTPSWPLTAVVQPDPSTVEALPSLTQELALVRPADPPRYRGDEAKRVVIDAFSRASGSTRSTSLVFDDRAEFVDVPETTSQQTVWVGDGIPLNAAAFTSSGYRNASTVTADGESADGLAITVVCNDAEMDREPEAIETLVDPREDLPLDLSTHTRLRRAELAEVIEAGTDYLHFVGHATPEGLQCIDGYLDVGSLAESNVDTFFLNACQSFRQGERLVEQGSYGGIVTYSDVTDTFALDIGSHVGRLLNAGFPIGACHTIISDTTAIGSQYTVVGNHAANLAHPDGGPPFICHVDPGDRDVELRIESFTTGVPRFTAGSTVCYAVDPSDTWYLFPAEVSFEVGPERLAQFLSRSDEPVVVDGELEPKAAVLEDLVEDRLCVRE